MDADGHPEGEQRRQRPGDDDAVRRAVGDHSCLTEGEHTDSDCCRHGEGELVDHRRENDRPRRGLRVHRGRGDDLAVRVGNHQHQRAGADQHDRGPFTRTSRFSRSTFDQARKISSPMRTPEANRNAHAGHSRSPSCSARNRRASSGDQCFGIERRGFGRGNDGSGLAGSTPVATACLIAPFNGARAIRIVFGDGPRPVFLSLVLRGSLSALGGTRTPNLLIRRWIRGCDRRSPLVPDGAPCEPCVGDSAGAV